MRIESPRHRPRFLACAVIMAAAAFSASAAQADGLSEAQFKALHKELAPQTQDEWRLLPWHTSIVDAVKQATKEKRPVYMLVRSGHPLGCV